MTLAKGLKALCLVALLFLHMRAISQDVMQICQKGHDGSIQKQQQQKLLSGITSPGHQQRMRQYDINYYKLDVALERTSANISGTGIIKAKVTSNSLSTFSFELGNNILIDAIAINGVTYTSFNKTRTEVDVPLQASLSKGADITAQITYHGTPRWGLYNVTENAYRNQITFSLSEPFDAAEWFPCKQVLQDKADSVEIWVTTDVSNKVGSNGLLQQISPMPDNKHRYEWKSRYPTAYYLLSVAVGAYREYIITANPAGASAPLQIVNYIYPNPEFFTANKANIDVTVPMLEFFSEKFGLYPFSKEKYGHSMAPLGGGMEHQTMTTQDRFEFSLTAHELAHQWFGNQVTCKTFEHIWLNEGFASYAEYLAYQQLKTPQEALKWLNNSISIAKSLPQGRLYVQDSTNVGRIFDHRLSYEKGAMVVHMLRYLLNDDAKFFQALREYQQTFKDRVAATADLQTIFEKYTGQSLAYFFNQWFYGYGFPRFTVTWNQKEGQLFLKNVQTTSSANTSFFTTHLDYKIITDQEEKMVRLFQEEPLELYQIPVKGNVLSIEVDPHKWVLSDVLSVARDHNLDANVLTTDKLVLYPNPVQGEYLFLKGVSSFPEQALVYDVVGRKVKELPYNKSNSAYNVSALRPGVYLLKLQGQDINTAIRFIKL